jgi:alpha-1,2-mannosyltransferase
MTLLTLAPRPPAVDAPRTPRAVFVPVVVAALALLVYGLVGWARGWPLGVDSSVYRAGAVLLIHGRSPYQANDLGYLHLHFTYPPSAALLFAPLAAVPAQLAWAFIAAASVLALAVVIRLAVAAVPYWRFPAAGSTVALTVALLCLVPVWRTIALGQVNILLMAMVTLDVLAVTARGSRWGGLLTGVAAAVKLVPLIFIPYLFLTGKRAAAVRALAVFAGLQALTLAVAPRDAAYWTSYMFQTNRVGSAQQPYNQSLDGLFTRLTALSPWAPYAAWVVGALLAVPAVALMLRYHRRGQQLSALCVTACYGLLLAPVSWLPDWVWMAPVVVALLSWLQGRAAGRRRWAAAAVTSFVAVFASTYSVPIGQQSRSIWLVALSDPYVLTTLAIAAVLAWHMVRRLRQELEVAGRDMGDDPVVGGTGAGNGDSDISVGDLLADLVRRAGGKPKGALGGHERDVHQRGRRVEAGGERARRDGRDQRGGPQAGRDDQRASRRDADLAGQAGQREPRR